eukprot:TRINITY_DN37973_c0_g1_i1.p1 TRINITY_DN37973_c0_g1~~TRINITY_DN37973_c0_g1_i1.p1  ORF type:complete len:1281 (+),score=218.14 TRINITY_DN37973_c0_g1_i1:149-3844(+)
MTCAPPCDSIRWKKQHVEIGTAEVSESPIIPVENTAITSTRMKMFSSGLGHANKSIPRELQEPLQNCSVRVGKEVDFATGECTLRSKDGPWNPRMFSGDDHGVEELGTGAFTKVRRESPNRCVPAVVPAEIKSLPVSFKASEDVASKDLIAGAFSKNCHEAPAVVDPLPVGFATGHSINQKMMAHRLWDFQQRHNELAQMQEKLFRELVDQLTQCGGTDHGAHNLAPFDADIGRFDGPIAPTLPGTTFMPKPPEEMATPMPPTLPEAVPTPSVALDTDCGEMTKAAARQTIFGKAAEIAGQMVRKDLGLANKSIHLGEDVYDVRNFYHDDGLPQLIARSDLFGNITLAIICVNAAYIGLDADRNHAKNLNEAHWLFQVCEHLFCIFFSFEWLIRTLAFRQLKYGLMDMWFKFDTFLVAIMVFETWIVPNVSGSSMIPVPTGMIKMLRLLRLARMARIMRAFPELVAMIKGVKAAATSVGSALLMLVCVLYIFAIIVHLVLGSDSGYIGNTPALQSRFASLTETMMTLLIDGTFMDSLGTVSRGFSSIPNVFLRICAVILLWLYVLMSALTVLNMLIGVLCEVVTAVAEREKEDNDIKFVKERLLGLMKEMDADGNGSVSQEEVHRFRTASIVIEVFEDLSVDMNMFMQWMDMHFEGQGDGKKHLPFHVIVELILQLRGERNPTMKDLQDMFLFQNWIFQKISVDTAEALKQIIEVNALNSPFITGQQQTAELPITDNTPKTSPACQFPSESNAGQNVPASPSTDRGATSPAGKLFGMTGSHGSSSTVHSRQSFCIAGGRETTALAEKPYNVESLYKTTGYAQLLARNEIFSNFTLGVICANAIYIGIDADWNTEANLNQADPLFQVCEHMFCLIFSFEWAVRFFSFETYRGCLIDLSFKFDTALVWMMWFETWIVPNVFSSGIPIPSGMIKMLRLLRLARMARLMRCFPELVAMIKGVRTASRAVGSALLMLVILVYVFGIIMHTMLGVGVMPNYVASDANLHSRFSNGLVDVMMTLLIDGTMMDSIGTVSRLLSASPEVIVGILITILFWTFVLMSALTVMNMLIGMLCEVVTAVARDEKEAADIRFVKDTVLIMLKDLDDDSDGSLNREEISEVFSDDHCLDVLRELNVDVFRLSDQFDMFFDKQGISAIRIDVVMELILAMRGNRSPTIQDLQLISENLKWHLSRVLRNSMLKYQDMEVMPRFQSLLVSDEVLQKTPSPRVAATPENQ